MATLPRMHDPRVPCHVGLRRPARRGDDEEPPFAYVLAEGEATIEPGLEPLRTAATRIGGRYMGADRAEEFGARNGVPGELLVRLVPSKVLARRGIAD